MEIAVLATMAAVVTLSIAKGIVIFLAMADGVD